MIKNNKFAKKALDNKSRKIIIHKEKARKRIRKRLLNKNRIKVMKKRMKTINKIKTSRRKMLF